MRRSLTTRLTTIFAAAALLGMSAAGNAFEILEEIAWPATGRFPAYPQEPPDGKTVRFSVFTGLMHDNNLFRLSDSVNPVTTLGTTEKSDTIFRYGAGVDVDLPISRQRLLLNAQVERRDFDEFGFLDHTAYRLGGVWRWVAGSQWSGDVGYDRRKALSPFGDIQAPIKDMITSDHAYGSAGYRFTPRWRVRGGLDWWKYDHSDPTRIPLDHKLGSGTLGVDYMTPADNFVGGQFKYSNGDYPNRQPVAATLVDNGFQEYEASLVAHWILTGKSVLDARAGYTKREHDQFTQRDYDGFTGRLSFDWFVGSKTLLNFAAWRELQAYEDVIASYVVAHGASFGPRWAPTDKIVLQARLVYERRDFEGDPGIPLGTTLVEREDKFKGIRLLGGWSPRRNIEVSVGVDWGDRTSNTLGADYDYTKWMANAKFRF